MLPRKPFAHHARTLWAVAAALVVASTGVAAQAASAASTPARTTAPAHNEQVAAATPYLGWSSWSTFRCNVNDQDIRTQALAMHDRLQARGYEYVNVDSDCANAIDAYGRKTYSPAQFPDMQALGAYVHSLGLRLGVYSYPGIPIQAVQENLPIYGTPYHAQDIIYPPDGTHPGNSLCQYGSTFQVSCRIDYSKPGAQAYIDSTVALYRSWGADLVKLDSVSPGSDTSGYDTTADVQAWHDAIERIDPRMQLILSWHLASSDAAMYQANSNGWRADDDIECYNTCSTLTTWSNPQGYTRDTIISRFFDAVPWAQYAGPGGWTNLDSLEVGNGAADGLSDTERQSAMTLWAIAGSPIYSGDDLTSLDSYGLSLLTNKRVLAVDQSGVAGHLVGASAPYLSWSDQQVWEQHLPDGSYNIALFNLAGIPEPVTATWQSLGFCGTAAVSNVWTGQQLGAHGNGITRYVPAHGSALLTVRKLAAGPCPSPAPAPAGQFYSAADPSNTITAPASVTSCSGCDGGVKVGNLDNGGAVTFNDVTVSRGGTYELTIRYAADDERTGYVSVNGGPEQLIGFFPRTGSWDTVGSYQIRIHLNAGTNTIKYLTHSGPDTFPGPRTYSPDLDGILVTQATH